MSGTPEGPSPLTVGKHFVKQYYQVLQTNPEQIHRFYQPTSFLSDAEGSTPTDPASLENYKVAERWGIEGTKKGFAMEIGAIDAQTSINSSILLVVTGSVSRGKEPRKTFVHTFFLTFIPNTKRYYVANDVLRFLAESEVTKEEEEPAVVEEKVESKPEEPPKEESKPVEGEAPGGGVEESKEPAPEDEEEPAPQPVPEETVVAEKKEKSKSEKEGGRKRGKAKAGQQPKQAPKPTPGSWASLVASGPAVTAPPPSPARAAAVEKTEPETKSAPAPQPQEKDKEGKASRDRPKRDPDCTLVIKNLPENTKDADLVALFGPFATATKGKIVSTTVSAHRGLGFVDYDSVPPVMAAIEKHGEKAFELNGRVLEVDQKTAEQRARRNVRGGNRSGSPTSGGRGGNKNKRGGRGDRGGRGGGRGGNK